MIAVFAMHSGLKKLKKVYKQVSAYVDLKKKIKIFFLRYLAYLFTILQDIFYIWSDRHCRVE